jgi:allantoicase
MEKVKEIIKTIPEFTNLTELASEKMGGEALLCTDDFFAEKENLLKQGRGVFITDKYTDRGKWMDGWESRRKRTEGHDWCILKLGVQGKIRGVDIDTNFFLGNHPPHASIEACNLPSEPNDWEAVGWIEILGKSHLDAGSQNFYEVKSDATWTHLKLHIYPDGGVARLRIYGDVDIDWESKKNQTIDLAAAVHGGRSLQCNDMFFSSKDNLIMPGKGVNMGDGWETKRNRTPNNVDWLIVELGHKEAIEKVMVDTHHFKGNFPDTCSLEGCNLQNATDQTLQDANWEEILPKSKLSAHNKHEFTELLSNGPFTHVKLKIYPDGGVSRLRVFGKISD